jgi:hypothetical protein
MKIPSGNDDEQEQADGKKDKKFLKPGTHL